MTGIEWPLAARWHVTQAFGRPALRIEPTMYLERDAKGAKRCKPTAFPGGVKYLDVHPAVDVACPIGTPLVAVNDGKVVAAGVYASTGEKYLMIRIHRGPKRQTIAFYTHLSRVLVPVGSLVKRGEKVALSGNSGMSTGPHVHFEIRVGSVNSEPWTSGGSAWFRYNPERLREKAELDQLAA